MSARDSVTGSYVEGDTSTPSDTYSYFNDPPPSGVNLVNGSPGYDYGKLIDTITNYAKTVVTGGGSPADYGAILAAIASLSNANKQSTVGGWKGSKTLINIIFRRRN